MKKTMDKILLYTICLIVGGSLALMGCPPPSPANNSSQYFGNLYQHGAHPVTVGDFNGDSYDDLAVGTNSNVKIFFNDGTGKFVYGYTIE